MCQGQGRCPDRGSSLLGVVGAELGEMGCGSQKLPRGPGALWILEEFTSHQDRSRRGRRPPERWQNIREVQVFKAERCLPRMTDWLCREKWQEEPRSCAGPPGLTAHSADVQIQVFYKRRQSAP